MKYKIIVSAPHFVRSRKWAISKLAVLSRGHFSDIYKLAVGVTPLGKNMLFILDTMLLKSSRIPIRINGSITNVLSVRDVDGKNIEIFFSVDHAYYKIQIDRTQLGKPIILNAEPVAISGYNDRSTPSPNNNAWEYLHKLVTLSGGRLINSTLVAIPSYFSRELNAVFLSLQDHKVASAMLKLPSGHYLRAPGIIDISKRVQGNTAFADIRLNLIKRHRGQTSTSIKTISTEMYKVHGWSEMRGNF